MCTVGKIITVTRRRLFIIHMITALHREESVVVVVRYGLVVPQRHQLFTAAGGGEEDWLTEHRRQQLDIREFSLGLFSVKSRYETSKRIKCRME